MFCMIDLTNCRFIARHAEYTALAALAHIQFPNCGASVFREEGNGQLAAFGQPEMRRLCENERVFLSRPGWLGMLNDIRAHVAMRSDLIIPVNVESAVRQARSIRPEDNRPFRINLENGPPILADRWSLPPYNFSFSRYAAQHWVHFVA